MEPTEQLATILPAITDLVEQLEPDDLDSPTPCDKFALVDVLDHMIVLGGAFGHLFRGEEPPEQSPPERNGAVPRGEFREVMDDLLDAVTSVGAMQRTISAPVGQMPGDTFARLVAFDGLVHGWDIARAAGLPYELPDEVVTDVEAFALVAITPEMRDGDTFKARTSPPADATHIERVAAFSGRTV